MNYISCTDAKKSMCLKHKHFARYVRRSISFIYKCKQCNKIAVQFCTVVTNATL